MTVDDLWIGLVAILTGIAITATIVKVCYLDVFGHWPSWREIFDSKDLRQAARIFNEIADYLDEQE